MNINEVFGDIADTIAHLNPEQIIHLKAPKKMSERVADLLNKKKESTLNDEEVTELERFLALDLFISLTKAKARVLLHKA